jgi:hypothetical protein
MRTRRYRRLRAVGMDTIATWPGTTTLRFGNKSAYGHDDAVHLTKQPRRNLDLRTTPAIRPARDQVPILVVLVKPPIQNRSSSASASASSTTIAGSLRKLVCNSNNTCATSRPRSWSWWPPPLSFLRRRRPMGARSTIDTVGRHGLVVCCARLPVQLRIFSFSASSVDLPT